jgi:hypothetical protein
LVDELKKRLAERTLKRELDRHLGSAAQVKAGNHRNGHGNKTVLTDTCHYRKLDPNVLMMYSSEERKRGNLPGALNASSDRCVLAQGEVSPHLSE